MICALHMSSRASSWTQSRSGSDYFICRPRIWVWVGLQPDKAQWQFGVHLLDHGGQGQFLVPFTITAWSHLPSVILAPDPSSALCKDTLRHSGGCIHLSALDQSWSAGSNTLRTSGSTLSISQPSQSRFCFQFQETSPSSALGQAFDTLNLNIQMHKYKPWLLWCKWNILTNY